MGCPMGVRWIATAIEYWPFPRGQSRRHLSRSKRERFAPDAGSVLSSRLRAATRSRARGSILARPATNAPSHSAAAVRREEFQCVTAHRDEAQRCSAGAEAGRAAGLQARVWFREWRGAEYGCRGERRWLGRGRATPAPPGGARRRCGAGMRSRSGGGERACPSPAAWRSAGTPSRSRYGDDRAL